MACVIEPTPADEGVYAISGDIDLTNAMDLLALPVPADTSRLVLDLSRVRFVDSYGVTAFIVLATRLGGELVLAHANETVAQTFRMLALADLPGIVIEP